MSGDLWGDPEDYEESLKKRQEAKEKVIDRLKSKFNLEKINSSEIDELPDIKARLSELERQNKEMRKQNKMLNRKLKYWREQSKELAELRLMRYKIKKDKSRNIIGALKRKVK